MLVTRMTVQALVVLVCGLLAASLAAAAQQPTKVPRIGMLNLRPPSDFQKMIGAFRNGLRDLGYVEGQNILIEYRDAGGAYERLPDVAAELVRLKVDVIVVGGNVAIKAAKEATQTIPIVMGASGDPVGAGFVASLARPGGNITGLNIRAGEEMYGKRLEILQEAVGKLSRVAFLHYATNPYAGGALRATEVAARTLGVRVQSLPVRDVHEFEGAFGAATRGRADGLITLEEAFMLLHRAQIAALAAKSRLPAMYGLREFVEAGGLMAYGIDAADSYRRAATYVDKILKGTKPADLPVEQPTRFELVINMKTAKALGLRIPRSLLSVADEVIQ